MIEKVIIVMKGLYRVIKVTRVLNKIRKKMIRSKRIVEKMKKEGN